MVDPVVDREGNSYSRAAIEAHIELVGEVSPVTGNVLARSMLVENVALRDAIARLGEGGREPRGSLPALMTPPPDERENAPARGLVDVLLRRGEVVPAVRNRGVHARRPTKHVARGYL